MNGLVLTWLGIGISSSLQAQASIQPPDHGKVTFPASIKEMSNRLSIRALRQYFDQSPFKIDWITQLKDERIDELRVVAEYLSRIVPYTAEELLTRGLSLRMTKI